MHFDRRCTQIATIREYHVHELFGKRYVKCISAEKKFAVNLHRGLCSHVDLCVARAVTT